MNRRRAAGWLAGGLFLFLATARGDSWLPAQNVSRSVSGQFYVSSLPDDSPLYQPPKPGTNSDMLRLEPALLAVSAERFKADLDQQLGLKPDAPWAGKIYLTLRTAHSLDDGVTIASGALLDRRAYRVDLPALVARTRYARALAAVLLLEIANRNAAVAAHSAEIPGWLADGLAQQVLALDAAKISLSTPGERNSLVFIGAQDAAQTVRPTPLLDQDDLPMSRLDEPQHRLDPLAEARRVLQNSPALTFEQLSWPTEAQVSQADGGIYFASAQLFVSELLALKNGPARLRAMLAQLPACQNWQTAFFNAFHENFPRPLAVEKWWALRGLAFAARAPGPRWTASTSSERLNEMLTVPVQFRNDAASLPTYAEISLQAAIRSLAATERVAVLHAKMRELEFAQMHVSPAYAALLAGYHAALADFLGEGKKKSATVATGKHAAATMLRKADLEDTLKKLDALDVRRREIDEKLKLNLPVERTVRATP